MLKIIHRGFALTLIAIMLLSVMCPVTALAEMAVTDDPDTDEITETTVENKQIEEELAPAEEETIVLEDSSSKDYDNLVVEEINPELVIEEKIEENAGQENKETEVTVEPTETTIDDKDNTSTELEQENTAEEPAGQENTKTEQTARATEATANSTDSSNTQLKQGNTAVGIQSADGAAAKTDADPVSSGSLSAADGSEKNTRTQTNTEMFISDKGSDESGNGSVEAPFATLDAALDAASEMGADVELCLLSNLSLTGTVQILGMNVCLTSNEGIFTITRDGGFETGAGGMSTAMFAIGTPAENSPGGQLFLEHVVLDEKGMKTDPVQDAMIAVYGGGKLILGEEAMLLNYGGESAVYAGAGSEVTISAASFILNDMPFEEDGTVAIREEEGSTVFRAADCNVLSHGEVWEKGKAEDEEDEQVETVDRKENAESVENNGNSQSEEDAEMLSKTVVELNGESSTSQEKEKTKKEQTDNKETGALLANEVPKSGDIQKRSMLAAGNTLKASPSPSEPSLSFRLEAPDSVSSSDTVTTVPSYVSNAVAGYEIPYTISVNVGSIIGSNGIIAAEVFEKATVKMTVTLDSLLYPVTDAAGSTRVVLNPKFNVLQVKSATYNEVNHAVAVELATDDAGTWKDHTEELEQMLVMTFKAVVPSGPTAHSDQYYPQKDKVSSSAKVDEISVILGQETRSFNPTEVRSSKDTKLLGPRRATLIYDPVEGTGGPGTQSLPAEADHALETSNVPAHKNVNGIPVLFYGWTLETDNIIYSDGASKPETVSRITLEENETVRVYAVYSYDRNNDGIPDVDQKLLTLGFDANGGTGAPDQMIKAAFAGIGASFDIPEKEPTRKYYTFLGWSEDENASEGKYKHDAPRKIDQDITITKDTCLYAIWKENPIYTLYFNGNGGSNVPAAQSARSDNGVAELTITSQIPTRSGRTFAGWSTQRYGTAEFDPGESVRLTGGDVTLYAVWERNGSSGGYAPKTGDESNVPMYAVLAIGSVIAASMLACSLRKRRG